MVYLMGYNTGKIASVAAAFSCPDVLNIREGCRRVL